MIVKPRTKGTICTNAHPEGCREMVKRQIVHAQSHRFTGPEFALVIGCSSGYGLASRISLAYGADVDSLGVCYEREPTERKTASAGWYNNYWLEQEAVKAGRFAESINGDAFSCDVKQQVIKRLHQLGRKVDVLVYSVAAPRRIDEQDGCTYQSVLKPVSQAFEGITLDTDKQQVKAVSIEPASDAEINATVKVMGGEDWLQWVSLLKSEGLLAEGVKTVAYTYIGDEITWPIYGDATIGMAKKHLDSTVTGLNAVLQSLGGHASIAVLKALVTQSSAAIPVMPLYISLLYKLMKEKNVHENCIEQIQRFFVTGLFGSGCLVDSEGRWRLDEFELADDIQQRIKSLWQQVTSENLLELSDFAGFKEDFLNLFGFSVNGVDYDADVAIQPDM